MHFMVFPRTVSAAENCLVVSSVVLWSQSGDRGTWRCQGTKRKWDGLGRGSARDPLQHRNAAGAAPPPALLSARGADCG